VKTIDPQANKETVMKKINNLRSSFRKERKKVLIVKKSGMSSEDLHATCRFICVCIGKESGGQTVNVLPVRSIGRPNCMCMRDLTYGPLPGNAPKKNAPTFVGPLP
jgi:hypothetical protein